MHRLNQETELFRQFLAHPLDASHEFSALIAVDQRDQAIPDLEPDEIDRLDVVPGELLLGGRPRCAAGGRRGLAALGASLLNKYAPTAQTAAIARNTKFGMPGMTPSRARMPLVTPSARG